MRLDPVGPDAAAALARVHATSFDEPWSASDIATLVGSPGGFALAVWGAGSIGGFILCRAIAGEAEVLTLAVDPAARRAGLGRALLEAAVNVALDADADAMFLEVAADNTAAIGLYAGAGFTRVGARQGYYARSGGAVDALVMRRDLNREAG